MWGRRDHAEADKAPLLPSRGPSRFPAPFRSSMALLVSYSTSQGEQILDFLSSSRQTSPWLRLSAERDSDVSVAFPPFVCLKRILKCGAPSA